MKRQAKAKSQKVYFILNRRLNAVKIGCAFNPMARMTELQVGNSEKLELLFVLPNGWLNKRTLDGWVDEYTLHTRFEKSRIRGEWYEYTDDIRDFVSTMIVRYNLTMGEICQN